MNNAAMNDTGSNDNAVTYGKATLYLRSEFGFGVKRVEVKTVTVRRRKYAQYSNAIEVTFMAPRKRLARQFVQTYAPSLVILEGWGHMDPGSPFGPREVRGGVEVSTTKYTSCDPRWQEDFDGSLADYISKSGAKVLADFRGASTY